LRVSPVEKVKKDSYSIQTPAVSEDEYSEYSDGDYSE